MDPLPPDPYKALGVDKNAGLAAIKTSYRKLVVKCHPDKVEGKQDQFHSVQQAYELLSNDEERRRYDDRVLRDALRTEKGTPNGGADFATGPGPGPVYEVHRETRNGHVYSTRVPRSAYDDEPRGPPPKQRSSDEDDYFSAKYGKARSASKRYEESYFDMPRRASARYDEKPRRARDLDDDFEQDRRFREKERMRAYEKKMRSHKDRARDLHKKRDSEWKSQSRTYSPVDDSSESDGSHIYHQAEPRPKYDDSRRRYDGEDTPRRTNKRANDHFSDEHDKEAHAKDYIQKSRGSAHNKNLPGWERFHPSAASPPPTTPTAPPVDVRRSSVRRASTRDISPIKLSAKDRRFTEIVEPRQPSSPRRPSMPGTSSDPHGLKNMVNSKRNTHKSATLDDIPETRHHPGLPRTGTVSMDLPRRESTLATKGSRLKETHDSGRSSPGTPEMKHGSSFVKQTKYHTPFAESPSSGSEEETVFVDKKGDAYRKSGRGSSGDKDHRRSKSDRPPTLSASHKHSSSATSATRGGAGAMPPRAGSYAFTTDTLPARPGPPPRGETSRSIPPPLSKESSARGGHRLFGEVKGEAASNNPYRPEGGYRIVHERPRLSNEDISYSSRRGSEDLGGGARERDRYPGSHRFSERDRRREARAH